MIERIQAEWKADDTLRTLSQRLDISRSALAGWYFRYKALKETHPLAGHSPGAAIQSRKQPRQHTAAEQRQYAQRAERIRVKKQLLASSEPLSEPTQPPVQDDRTIGAYNLLSLPANGCKWPYGHSGGFTFCGDPRVEDGKKLHVYCAAHKLRAKGRLLS